MFARINPWNRNRNTKVLIKINGQKQGYCTCFGGAENNRLRPAGMFQTKGIRAFKRVPNEEFEVVSQRRLTLTDRRLYLIAQKERSRL
jgi:hypothetical protein